MRGRPRSLVDEPTTTLTDYAISIAATACAVLILNRRDNTQLVTLLIASAFVSVALGAALGGTSHGFSAQLAQRHARLVWATSLLCAQAASLLLAYAALIARMPGAAASIAALLLAIKTALFTARIVRSRRFADVAYDAALSLGVVALVEAGAWLRGPAASAPGMLAAVAVTAAGVIVQRSGRGLPTSWLRGHFNHNNLMHIAQLLATWLFYRGALELPG